MRFLISLKEKMENQSKEKKIRGAFNAVPLREAQEMTFKWQNLVPPASLNIDAYPKSFQLSKFDFVQILNEPSVKYIKAYPAVKQDEDGNNKITLLFVGVAEDENGDTYDVVFPDTEASGIYDFAFPCPNTCGSSPLYEDQVLGETKND